MKQYLIRTTDASTPNAGDILVNVYDDGGITASPRNGYDTSRWDPPLPVHRLSACEGCHHRYSDHAGGVGACDLCDCPRLGGVR